MKTLLALGAAMALTGAAEAKKPSIWVQCDGYAKPEPGATKLIKGLAAISTLGLFGLPEQHDAQAKAHGEAGIEACKSALADPAAASASWLRRVTLNQGMALHQLEAKQPEAALQSLDAAAAAAGENGANPFFVRSTGLSLELLRAAALIRLGRTAEGMERARKAAEARPYSARVQMVALGMMALDPAVDKAEAAIADKLLLLDPSSGEAAANIYLRSGRYAEAWKTLKRKYESEHGEGGKAKGLGFPFTDRALSSALVTAFAAARAGEGAAAGRILDDQALAMKTTAEQLMKMKLNLAGEGKDAASIQAALVKPIESWRPVVEAAALVAGGNHLAAQDKLAAAAGFAGTPLISDLVDDIRAKVPAEARKGIVAADAEQARSKVEEERKARLEKLTGAELFSLLPEPEDEKRLNSFSKQAGWGLKPTGFKHKTLENGRTRIEFVGSTSSPLAVEEMTLLRAATLAKQAGRKAFVVESRSDYERFMQTTYGGTPIGARIPAGYKTEVEVSFTDDLAAPGAQEAEPLLAALTPIYVRQETKGR